MPSQDQGGPGQHLTELQAGWWRLRWSHKSRSNVPCTVGGPCPPTALCESSIGQANSPVWLKLSRRTGIRAPVSLMHLQYLLGPEGVSVRLGERKRISWPSRSNLKGVEGGHVSSSRLPVVAHTRGHDPKRPAMAVPVLTQTWAKTGRRRGEHQTSGQCL